MATIKFVDAGTREFVSAGERAKSDPVFAERLKNFAPEVAEVASFVHHPGNDEEPELFEVRLPPGAKVDSHAHRADEIIVVTAGQVIFGKQTYGPGSSVFIPKMTLYSFQAGPDGLTFLNFRPVKGGGSVTKAEFLAVRADMERASAAAPAE
jgi:quercetin dioxygenase-like cupin family protein